jgi:hypothetical protein
MVGGLSRTLFIIHILLLIKFDGKGMDLDFQEMMGSEKFKTFLFLHSLKSIK